MRGKLDWADNCECDWSFLSHEVSYFKGLGITKEDLVDEGVPVISYGQIHSKTNDGMHLRRDLLRYIPRTLTEGNENCRLRRGDIVFADTSEDVDGAGNCILVDTDDEIYAGYHTLVARPKNPSCGVYLARLFQSVAWRSQIQSRICGIKVFSITRKILKGVSVLTPSEESQRQIVAYLDEKTAAIDARVEVLEKKLAAYRRLKTSVINRAVTRGVPGWGADLGLGERDDRDHRDERDGSHEALATHCRAASGAKAPKRRVSDLPEVSGVPCRGRPVNRLLRDSGVDWIGKIPEGWGVAHLKRLTKKIGSGKTPAGGAEVYGAEGVMFLRSQNVYNDGLMLNDVAFITPHIDLEMSSTRVFAGDVLLNITGGSIGRCCVYTRQEHANVNQHVCIIRADTKRAHNAFIKYFWNSLGQVYLRLSQLGGNRESLNFEQIGNVLFPVPPLPEQRAIADYLDAECAKIDKMAELVTREIELYKKLKRSLINEVVTGKREVV